MTLERRLDLPAMSRPVDATPENEEARWVARARAGEEAAYDWLLNRYRQRAIRLAAHVMRRPDEAEDAVQEALIRAFRGLRSFRGEGAFYTWLYAIVVRTCVNRLRGAHRRPEVEMVDAPDPADPLGTAERRMEIDQVMRALSPPIRAALVLRELEGLEYEEIAEVLEIPVGTVRSRLHAARQQFRELWQAARREANDV